MKHLMPRDAIEKPGSMEFSRRSFVTAAVSVGLVGPLLLPGKLQARQTATTSVHRLKLGDIEVVVLSDGYMLQPVDMFGVGIAAAERTKAFAAGGISGDRVQAAINVTLVRTGSEVVLIDCGAGPNFVDTAGKLEGVLAAAGVDAETVTKVVLTHGHADHLWGAIDEFDNAPRFPNAKWLLSKPEWDLWMTGNPSAKVPADRQNFIAGAKRNLKGLDGRLELITPGQPLGRGLVSIDTAGHTQGHIAVAVSSGNETAIVVADALINAVASFAHPDWRIAADHEPDRAIATRKRLLEQLATDRHRIIGYHLAFPGIGHVERNDNAYRFVADA